MAAMEHLWIPITIAAALAQAVRTALQRQLARELSNAAGAYARFLYGAPLALAYVLLLWGYWHIELPTPDTSFFVTVTLGGIAQVLATVLLLAAVNMRSMPVGVAFSKTEVVQAAIAGFIFLGEPVTAMAALGILLATLGVMGLASARMSGGPKVLLTSLGEPSAIVGIASGAGFALSAIGFRAAALSLSHPNPVMAAGYTLAWATAIQTVIMGVWLLLRERAALWAVARNFRASGLVGLTSVVGSACWFLAMTIQVVAYVRTLGLIELAFGYAISVGWLGETIRRSELLGMGLVALGIATLLLAG
jgi:drug/metabolite transporter (DMT)-like permease